jgi:transcriptional regulator with XRE-family HTH domain
VSEKSGERKAETMSVFSERISELMKSSGLSQKELAAKAGVTESAMSYYVKGERMPRSDVLTRIAKALETTTDYLLGNTSEAALYSTDEDLQYLQRHLGKLNTEQLKTAEKVLKAVFSDIFDDDEDEE